MKVTKKAALVLLALAVFLPTAGRAEQGPAFLPSVVSDGMAFPVARSNFYSVINFRNDWHAPRMRFIGGRWRQVGVHEGNDVFAEPGSPIVSVTAGRVEQIGWTFYSGWRVGIRDSAGSYWFYAHMSRFAPRIEPGVTVAPGDALGYVGNTGYGNQPGHHDEFTFHLHLGIQEPGGVWVNPYPILRRLYRKAVTAQR